MQNPFATLTIKVIVREELENDEGIEERGEEFDQLLYKIEDYLASLAFQYPNWEFKLEL